MNGVCCVSAESQIRLSFEEQVEWAKYGLIGRIVNGTKAALRQFPYQVPSMRDDIRHVFSESCETALDNVRKGTD